MFLQDTAYLGALESYPQLTSRAERIGYRISKVVYRGYQAPQKLQVRVQPVSYSTMYAACVNKREVARQRQTNQLHPRTAPFSKEKRRAALGGI